MAKKRRKDLRLSKEELLGESILGVVTTHGRDKEAMRTLVYNSVCAFRQGSGLIWSDLEELLDAIYRKDEDYTDNFYDVKKK